MKRTLAALLAICSVSSAAPAATDPGQSGPYATGSETVAIPGSAGATLNTDVYYPRVTPGVVAAAALPCPVIVLGHGFSQSKSQHVKHGQHLASRGFIVLVPNFAGGSDHSRNADDLSKCVDWIVARNADSASRYHRAVRVKRIGATGHSTGGLSALVATARDPRIRALAPMDPVDNASLGAKALAKITVPVAITYSEPSSCNASGSAAVLFAAARPHKRGIKIVNANHTDAQDPAGALSILFCGGANPTRQMLYRRYVTGWFEYFLKGDASYAPYFFNLPGGQTAADLAANLITYSRTPAASAIGEWRAIHFGEDANDESIAGPAADPDEDELVNFTEYALGLDPTTPSAEKAPFSSRVEANEQSFGAITFTRATMPDDVAIAVELSTDLLEWNPGSTYSAAGSEPNTALTSEVARTGSGVETITVRANVPLGGTEQFLRLQMRDLTMAATHATR
ncbi:hypothetical protein BH20VER2_BH20VER2_08820 [soil metagenome]